MRVFVTGATGFIGSAIVQDLIGAGHEVLGMVRSDANAEKLTAIGVQAHRGDLEDLDSLAAGARACDGVIHTAYVHDFSKFEANAETDRLATDALARAIEGTGKPLVVTSGVGVPGPGGTEDDPPSAEGIGAVRGKSELVLAYAGRGVRVSVVRLPPSVHGAGDHGFVPMLIGVARQKGLAAYVGDGANVWGAPHRYDAARLFRMALESAPAGARLHALAEDAVPMRAIAETIAAGIGVPARGLTPDEAQVHFGWMAMFAGRDMTGVSALTRQRTGWAPQGPDLLQDMRENYFG